MGAELFLTEFSVRVPVGHDSQSTSSERLIREHLVPPHAVHG